MSNLVKICPVAELPMNLGVGALVSGQQVALFKLNNGDVYAIGNFDPFSEANVLSRGLVGDLQGQKVVASPIYKHHYNLQTGECLEDSTVKVPAYQVVVQNEDVYLAV
ncbi:MAG: nitrite reductase small subunit NirD [Pseudomonadales bacterium]|nr:nitrite reductase small subunit NirD [Pseudomonadales bacterium]